jgi:glyoxylase-like metal-dependent hydrolase (beta-lactamase superfamily II)
VSSRDERIDTTVARRSRRVRLSVPIAALLAISVSIEAQRPQVRSPRLYVFDCGVLVRGEPTAYNLTREQVGDTNFSDACYLVVHANGTLLWDVGIIPDSQIGPNGADVAVGRGGNRNQARKTLASQLAAIGYRPADITYLAVSHGHADHVANANDYAGSIWLVQKAEREAMFSQQARTTPAFATYSSLERSKAMELSGDHDVFGDGTVVLKSTPGHTPGHQSLFIKLARTGPVVLSGDLYHYQAERTFKTLPNNDNKPQTQASRDTIDGLLKNSGAALWIQHVIQANAKLRKSPEFYD